MICKKQKTKLIILEKEKKCVERYFFKYAFPCAQVKLKLGSMTPESYDELEELFLRNGCPDKKTLEKTFSSAFKRIKKLAEKYEKNMWDFKICQKYWRENHNEIINEGDGMYGTASENFKDLCKIHEARIIEKNKGKLIIKYDNNERAVSNFLVPDAEVGDRVTIHFAFAIEKI